MHKRLQIAILITILFVFGNPFPGQAATGIDVQQNRVDLNFPKSLDFELKASSTAKIKQVTLIYGVSDQTCISGEAHQELEFEPGVSVSLSWTWDRDNGYYLPPGVEIWWQWQIRDEAGSEITTERQTYIIEDSNHKWFTRSAGDITVLWSKGSEQFGASILAQARLSTERLAKEAGITAPRPMRLLIYPSSKEIVEIMSYLPDWTGGVAYPEYSLILIGIAPGQDDWIREVVPHEIAHLLLEQRIYNCQQNSVPTWLNEGLAVYSEGAGNLQANKRLRDALQSESLPSLATLNDGFPANAGRANLSYDHSGAVVQYMIKTYGPEKLDEMLVRVRDGQRYDLALRYTYGLDADGLDKTWRASLNFGEAPTPATPVATQPPKKRTAIPTLALSTQAVQATATATPPPHDRIITPVVTSTNPTTPVVTAAANNGATRMPIASLLIGIGLAGAAILLLLILFVALRVFKKNT